MTVRRLRRLVVRFVGGFRRLGDRVMVLAQVTVVVEEDRFFLDVVVARDPDFEADQAQGDAGQENERRAPAVLAVRTA